MFARRGRHEEFHTNRQTPNSKKKANNKILIIRKNIIISF